MYAYLLNTDIELYDVFNTLSFFILIIFNIVQAIKHKSFYERGPGKQLKKRNKTATEKNYVYALKAILLSVLQFAFAKALTVEFGDLVNTGANYFGVLFIAPILMALGCILIGTDMMKSIDLLTPAFPLSLIFVKIACFCAGCCRGIEWSYGFFNHETNKFEFPSQLLEANLALLIFIFLVVNFKKFKKGTVFPVYLITYSGSRFFAEFLRNEPDIIWYLKTYHLLCILGCIVGGIELLVVRKYGEKITSFCFSCSDFIYQKWLKFASEKGIIHKKT